jgi:hypothetical protein
MLRLLRLMYTSDLGPEDIDPDTGLRVRGRG